MLAGKTCFGARPLPSASAGLSFAPRSAEIRPRGNVRDEPRHRGWRRRFRRESACRPAAAFRRPLGKSRQTLTNLPEASGKSSRSSVRLITAVTVRGEIHKKFMRGVGSGYHLAFAGARGVGVVACMETVSKHWKKHSIRITDAHPGRFFWMVLDTAAAHTNFSILGAEGGPLGGLSRAPQCVSLWQEA